MSFDPLALRREFPAFGNASGPLHYLDNAATSQIHRVAADAAYWYDTHARANIQRGSHRLAQAADEAYDQARRRTAAWLNADDVAEVVFCANATAALNLVATGLTETLKSGDEVVVSQVEHHSNLLPWQRACARSGARLRAIPLAADGRLDLSRLPEIVSERCRVVAVTHASNVTGAITDVAAIAAAARAVGALLVVDGAQLAQHGPVDVPALGADFYAFSGHKCFGPTGIGVLWGRRTALEGLSPLLLGGGMAGRVALERSSFGELPARLEAGTPPIAQAIGLGAVLDWQLGLPWKEIRAHEMTLARCLVDGLRALPGLRLIGAGDTVARLPLVSFVMDGLHPHDVCQVLGDFGIAVRGGHLCAQPLMAALAPEGVVRASLAFYNNAADIDMLIVALPQVAAILS